MRKLFLLLAIGATGRAAILDLKEAVRPKLSYAALLRQVCRHLEVRSDHSQANVKNCVPIYIIASDDQSPVNGDSILQNVSTVDLKIPGKPQLLLKFQIRDEGEELASPYKLALFEMGEKPRLLDVVEAPSSPDHGGDLWENGVLHLSPTADAFVFETFHWNSQQGYHDLEVMYVYDGKIRLIDAAMLLKCRSCNDGNFEETATIATAPDPGRPFNKILFRVSLDLQPDDPGTDRRVRTRRERREFVATYRWDATRLDFIDPGKTLEKLAAFNEKNQ